MPEAHKHEGESSVLELAEANHRRAKIVGKQADDLAAALRKAAALKSGTDVEAKSFSDLKDPQTVDLERETHQILEHAEAVLGNTLGRLSL